MICIPMFSLEILTLVSTPYLVKRSLFCLLDNSWCCSHSCSSFSAGSFSSVYSFESWHDSVFILHPFITWHLLLVISLPLNTLLNTRVWWIFQNILCLRPTNATLDCTSHPRTHRHLKLKIAKLELKNFWITALFSLSKHIYKGKNNFVFVFSVY